MKRSKKLHLLCEESLEDLCRRRLDQKLEIFNFENIEKTYEHINLCIEETSEEVLRQEEGRPRR